MQGWVRFRSWLDSQEIAISSWMERHGFRLLRIAMGIIFIWFGALKPFGLSPAEALVARATAWIPIPGVLYVLAVWEVTIVVCFLHKRLVRWGVVLLFLHMPGTMLPLITLPDETWVRFPFALSLEGQYIVNNPPLILLHGGPGLGETALFRHFNAPLEKRFTLVYWDQRGAGKSYDRGIPRSSMTVDQFLNDLDELVDAVCKRVGATRVVLFGHSWGSVLGVLYAARFPEKVAAYVGSGQIGDWAAAESASYESTARA